ncbi:MAG: hypothetical protein M3Y04_04730 [Actinomycetota bacterium]|nr:hypothetical protein [Actinomycetota bacterium]
MSDEGNQDPAGESDHPQHRAGAGEGVRAPLATETGVSEISIFDGKGNETVVYTTTDADGNRAQGTGATSEEAAADAERLLKDGGGIGKGFGPVH